MELVSFPSHEQELTPGERLFLALGQVREMCRPKHLPLGQFTVDDVTRIAGVLPELDAVEQAAVGTAYHFGGQVVLAFADRPEWRLLAWVEWERIREKQK
jgi:hypothetical protein